MVTICKEFDFDAAHKLEWHDGKCKNLHGHTYILKVYARGELNENDIVMDFGDLKKIVNETVIDKLDHSDLNTTFDNSTAEQMVTEIFKWLQKKDTRIFKVRLYESPTSYAEIES